MRHVTNIAGRELRSLFVSPVAYLVLSLFSIFAGVLFVLSVVAFDREVSIYQQMGRFDVLEQLNLNDALIAGFYDSMSFVMLMVVPAITMGLFTTEKANGTQEMLMTSPLTIWDIVIGKFLAGAGFAALLVGIVGLFPLILFYYGDPGPEVGQTLSGLLGVLLAGWTYVAIGTFASSLTRSQVVAFFLTLVLLLVLLLLQAISAYGVIQSGALGDFLNWLSTIVHVRPLLEGQLDTADLSYFAVMIGTFLLLTHATVESVRWR